jgi:hypothetical protein
LLQRFAFLSTQTALLLDPDGKVGRTYGAKKPPLLFASCHCQLVQHVYRWQRVDSNSAAIACRIIR